MLNSRNQPTLALLVPLAWFPPRLGSCAAIYCHEPKMPLLTELENLFGFILQRFRAYGAAGQKLNSTNCLS
jgi:hypothetical protein